NLRTAGIRLADVRGFSYDRRDVTGRWLANAYAQTLGSIFAEHQKPFEVELCVAEVARPDGGDDQLFKISYDGSITDEGSFVVMGGVTESVSASLKESYTVGWDLPTALRPDQVEVAILDRTKTGRTFRRVEGRALEALLEVPAEPEVAPVGGADPADEGETPDQ